MKNVIAILSVLVAGLVASPAFADVLPWKGPANAITIGLSEIDIAHVEFPEEIINVTVEDPDYVDILVVEGYSNRAFRMRSLLPKMATRLFMTGRSQNTYIVVVTTDVPYRAFLQVVDATKVDAVAEAVARKFDANDMMRAMAQEKELPGVMRETYIIPQWFKGAGLNFELTEIWQSPKLTGLVVQVQNEFYQPNEVNLPAVTIPRTDEWGVLRKAAMENLRMAPKGRPGDKGVLFLVFER